MIYYKSKHEIEAMKRPNSIVAAVLDDMKTFIQPGITTAQIDRRAEEIIRSMGAVPSFKGYGQPPFPASVCTSVNDAVVHGIPSERFHLKEGDIISIDCGACVNGWHGDAARTYAVGEISPEAKRLMEITEAAFWAGYLAVSQDRYLNDMTSAIGAVAERHHVGNVSELTGHGIGRNLHEEPSVFHFDTHIRGPRLRRGMVLAVEPMFTAGRREVAMHPDDWTIMTQDGSLAAHYENTFAIADDGPLILTQTSDIKSPELIAQRIDALRLYLTESSAQS